MNQTRVIKRYKLKQKVKELISKLGITIILLLIGLITIKQNPEWKENLKEKIYTESTFSMKARNLYQEYFSIHKEKIINTQPVSKETMPYQKIMEENNQVTLTFSSTYSVPVIENGVLVYLDEDQTIMEQIDGVRVTYKNINVTNYKLYDYIEKGEILGETKTNELVLSFQKEGEPIDYQKYL